MEIFLVLNKKEAILSPPFLLLLGPCVSNRTKFAEKAPMKECAKVISA